MSKSTHFFGQPVYGQLIKTLDHDKIVEISRQNGGERYVIVFCYVFTYRSHLTSSKTTLTDYQCVSTGCCTHVAKTEITIDNQHVIKSLQRYRFLPKQPKENTEKIKNLMFF